MDINQYIKDMKKAQENIPKEPVVKPSIFKAYLNVLKIVYKQISWFVEPFLLMLIGVYLLSLGSMLFYLGFVVIISGFVYIFINIFKTKNKTINYNTSYWNRMVEDPVADSKDKDKKPDKKLPAIPIRLVIIILLILLLVGTVYLFPIKK